MSDDVRASGLKYVINLARPLLRREIRSRYRGSVFGLAWSFLLPLFMLGIYTFAFGVVLKARWNVPGREVAEHSTSDFAIILFAGLILYQFFSEVVGGAAGLVVGNANYVKKVVFPIQILSVISVGTALFHAAISMCILIIFTTFLFGLSWQALIGAPLAFAAFVPFTLGVSWFLSAAGVYFRDIGQIMPPALTALLYLSPILFPRSVLPESMQTLALLNPLTVPVETFRNALIFGQAPDWTLLLLYSIISVIVAVAGLAFFNLVRRGFADVL